MNPVVTRLHPLFAAKFAEVDLGRPMTHMHRQRIFRLLMTLVAAATSTLWQDVVRAGERGASAEQTSASIPDFSGIWAHPYWPGFEPPQSGPGPVTNKSRLRRGPQSGVSNPSQLVGDYTNPILKPWAAEIVKKHGEIELSGMAAPTPLNQCWPGGVPFIRTKPSFMGANSAKCA